MTYERNYHSFVSDVVCERWDIAVCRKYLLGSNFDWLCDCSDIKKVLEYNVSIRQLKHWSQDLLAYEFDIIHQPNKMMKDVDAISRYIDPLINQYLVVSSIMRDNYVRHRPFA